MTPHSKNLIIYTQGEDSNLDLRDNEYFDFPDSLDAPTGTGDAFARTWGIYPSGFDGDPVDFAAGSSVPLDLFVDYLHSFDSNYNTPVFSFDMNEASETDNKSVLISGSVYLWDPTGGDDSLGAIAVDGEGKDILWAFDEYDDPLGPSYEPEALATAHGSIPIGDAYVIDGNKGNNSVDFLAYAPTMDLSAYYGLGLQLRMDFYLKGIDNGVENLVVSGQYLPFETPTVPEPATLLLFGTGLAGFALRMRKS